MKKVLCIFLLLVAFPNLFVAGNAVCDEVLNQLTRSDGDSSSSVLSEACSPINDARACPSGCSEKVQEIITACENEVFDFSSLVEAISCYDWNVCSAVTSRLYSPYSSVLCPADDSASECGKPCINIINAVESACVEPDGNMPPEFFVDTLFGNSACKQYAFSKAIERSPSECNAWTNNHSVRFEDVCGDECTDECVSILDKMLDRCKDSPGFDFDDIRYDQPCYNEERCFEDIRQAYNGVCQNQLVDTYISRGLENLESFSCNEMIRFYSLASGYLCLPDSNATECGKECVDIVNGVESACFNWNDDGSIPPEYFLDTLFGHPACKQYAFSKAIERSPFECNAWTKNHSVRFEDVCGDECTDECVSIMDKMLDRCKDSPGFDLVDIRYDPPCYNEERCFEDIRQAYNGVCQNQLVDAYISRGLENLESFSCYEMIRFYSLASGYLCLPDSNATECGKECVDIVNGVESACFNWNDDGSIPPEYFLDTLFGHPACKQYAFSKAIERSPSECNAWTKNHPIRFEDVCAEECTDECVSIMDKMLDRCKVSPGFDLDNLRDDQPCYIEEGCFEDIRQAYNGVCQKAFACLDDPSSCSTSEPTLAPSRDLNVEPTTESIPLKETNDFPLARCEGDCDKNDDCEGDLVCFQRGSNVVVPGCDGGEQDDSRTDYCVSQSSLPAMSPETNTELPIQESTIFPLTRCQGDCDSDLDCEGDLICFQRDEKIAVPGCVGGESDVSRTDYCVRPTDSQRVDSSSASHINSFWVVGILIVIHGCMNLVE